MTERTSLTDADLDRIEAEANAATPGPWSASEAVEYRPRQGPFSDTGASIWSESQKHPSGDEQEVVAGGMQDEQGGAVGVLLNADARFIAASRTNVPTLIAEVRRLRAAQTTTLIACSRCGHGHRARHMVVTSEDERLCVACVGDESERLRARIAELEEGLRKILAWTEAYPLDIFPEPDLHEARMALQARQITLDAVSASAIRHVIRGLGDYARAALASASAAPGGDGEVE